VVTARADKNGVKHLVGYIVPRAENAVSGPLLSEFLAAKLPQFLIPSYFVTLKSLPLNANGKVERRALPEPDSKSTEEPDSSAAPRTATEQLVAGIWRDLLGCKAIGIHQNFFHLGCHSLLATQATSRIAKVFGVELPVRTIFESPTVAGLAEKVVLAQENREASKPLETRSGRPETGEGGTVQDNQMREEVQPLVSMPELKTALS